MAQPAADLKATPHPSRRGPLRTKSAEQQGVEAEPTTQIAINASLLVALVRLYARFGAAKVAQNCER